MTTQDATTIGLMMHLHEAEELATDLMDDHALDGWAFAFDNAKTRCGQCHHGKRLITLSRHYVEHNNRWQIHDTILHEIAHALVGPGAGHGPRWKAMAVRIGAKPDRCNYQADMPDGRYRGHCGCGYAARYTFHRRPRRAYRCPNCSADIAWVG